MGWPHSSRQASKLGSKGEEPGLVGLRSLGWDPRLACRMRWNAHAHVRVHDHVRTSVMVHRSVALDVVCRLEQCEPRKGYHYASQLTCKTSNPTGIFAQVPVHVCDERPPWIMVGSWSGMLFLWRGKTLVSSASPHDESGQGDSNICVRDAAAGGSVTFKRPHPVMVLRLGFPQTCLSWPCVQYSHCLSRLETGMHV